MEFASYWHATAPRFAGAAEGPASGKVDVAVIGGGFTGLSAARTLAHGGATVAVLEADHVGAGASGRNGGHVNNGLAHSYPAAKAALGAERAKALWRAFDDAVDTVERIVAEEAIDCAFRRSGKLKLASKPSHFAGIAANFEAIHAEVDPATRLLSRDELAAEIGSDAFHGAMLYEKSAMMHMGRFVTGLAEAAVRAGAAVHEDARVLELSREGGAFRVRTAHGTLKAERVFLATNGYTGAPFPWFRRRIVPVGSFIVATRPLSEAEVRATMPGDRTCVTSLNIGNYFRLSPDRRLIFGGRARFSATSDPTSDAASGKILAASLARVFPSLAGVQLDYCWGGMVGMTRDRFPRAGETNGINYSMGYSGHGAQMSVHMGAVMADLMLGRIDRNALAGLEWAAVPGHLGKPWFLPLVGAYYSMKDLLG